MKQLKYVGKTLCQAGEMLVYTKPGHVVPMREKYPEPVDTPKEIANFASKIIDKLIDKITVWEKQLEEALCSIVGLTKTIGEMEARELNQIKTKTRGSQKYRLQEGVNRPYIEDTKGNVLASIYGNPPANLSSNCAFVLHAVNNIDRLEAELEEAYKVVQYKDGWRPPVNYYHQSVVDGLKKDIAEYDDMFKRLAE